MQEVKEKKNKTWNFGEGCRNEEGDGQKARDMCRTNNKNKADNCVQNIRQMK